MKKELRELYREYLNELGFNGIPSVEGFWKWLLTGEI
jgi:hypothetical protein